MEPSDPETYNATSAILSFKLYFMPRTRMKCFKVSVADSEVYLESKLEQRNLHRRYSTGF